MWNPGVSAWNVMGRGDQYIVFYAKDGRIVKRKPIWIQGKRTTLIQMFERIGLETNLGNTNSMA